MNSEYNPAHIALVGLPHASPKRIKVINSQFKTLILFL
jgi:hypothetical protein